MYIRTRQEALEHKPKLRHKFRQWLVLRCDSCDREYEIKFSTERMNRPSHYCSRICFAAGSKTTIQRHREQTCLKRYGVKNTFASPEKQQAIRSTLQRRYGVNNPQQNIKIRHKTSQTCLKKYGVPFAIALHGESTSKVEQHIISKLRNIFNDVQTQVCINDRWYVDAYIPSKEVYVEIDGIYWHRLDDSTTQLMEQEDLEGLRKRLRDLEVNQWFVNHGASILRIDERTANNLTKDELKMLVEDCKGFSCTYDYPT